MQQDQNLEFLNEIDGDLFTYCNSSDWKTPVPSQVEIPTDCKISKSMCHCVSVDLNMGAGIAVIFKKKYGCVDGLKEQEAGIGEMATLYVPSEEMMIYYLVTKQRYFHIPTYESLKSSLLSMKQHMIQHNISHLAMPQIGIGLDKLEWPKVKEILGELFSETNIKITVYRYKEGNNQVKSTFKKNETNE